MATRFIDIQITGGTSPGLYDIYYDLINPALLVSAFTQTNTFLAKNLTLLQMQTGFIIGFPDTAKKIILYNQKCKTSQTFMLDPIPLTYPPICLLIFDLENSNTTNLQFEYSNQTYNSKPLYSGTTGQKLVWSNNGYWDLSGFTIGSTIFRSTDFDVIPETNWNAIGVNLNNYIVISQTGNCSNIVSNFSFLSAKGYDASCEVSDGAIDAKALGGSGNWEYSIDGSNYQTTGLFTNLPKNTYIVYAKDSLGNLLSETVVVDAPPVNEFSIQSKSTSTKQIEKIGFIQYYETEIVYDTSLIPSGETVTFNYIVEYNMIYSEPGKAYFETDQNLIIKNSLLQPISLISTITPTISGPSDCNPLNSIWNSFKEYKTPQISLSNGDSFVVKFVYGINTDEDGEFISPCFTKSSININSYLTDVEYSCNCCKLSDTQILISQQQNFQA